MSQPENSDEIIRKMQFKLCVIQDYLQIYRDRTAQIEDDIATMEILEDDTVNNLEELLKLIASTEDKVKEIQLDIRDLMLKSQEMI